MVTTRRGNGNHIVDSQSENEDSIVVSVPKKSRKRASDDEATTSADMKRQKILPVRVKDEGPRKNTRVVVEILVRRESRNSAQIKSTTGEGLEKTAKSRGLEEDDTPSHNESRLEILDSASEDDDEDVDDLPKKVKKVIQDEQDSDVVGATVKEATKHRRFGSEEPEPVLEPEFFSTARESNELGEESSDDDAPEIVGIQDSLKDVKLKERDVAKAVERQESAVRNKRKEQDAFLKRQAESASKKRKPVENPQEEGESPIEEDESNEVVGEDISSAKDAGTFKARHGIASMPKLLPAEYLEDEENEEAEDVVEPPIKRSKLKFLDLVEKKPKDRRVGSTTYRVSETVRNSHMAPKSSFQARSTKEAWLQGRPGKNGSNRKPFTNSFFKSKK